MSEVSRGTRVGWPLGSRRLWSRLQCRGRGVSRGARVGWPLGSRRLCSRSQCAEVDGVKGGS